MEKSEIEARVNSAQTREDAPGKLYSWDVYGKLYTQPITAATTSAHSAFAGACAAYAAKLGFPSDLVKKRVHSTTGAPGARGACVLILTPSQWVAVLGQHRNIGRATKPAPVPYRKRRSAPAQVADTEESLMNRLAALKNVSVSDLQAAISLAAPAPAPAEQFLTLGAFRELTGIDDRGLKACLAAKGAEYLIGLPFGKYEMTDKGRSVARVEIWRKKEFAKWPATLLWEVTGRTPENPRGK
jgi:hypothetical protein